MKGAHDHERVSNCTGDRGSTPPGSARDGSRPSEGAIKGGAILPGESGGVAGAGSDPGSAAGGAGAPRERAERRCYELEGTLREQCLHDAREAERKSPVLAPPQEGR